MAAALGLASALGWDLSAVGDSDNRGVGTPLSREESSALLKAHLTPTLTLTLTLARSRLPCSRRSCALLRCERGRLLSEGALCLRAVRGITHPTG